ncbi:AAA family ATPase [Saccharothrix violaceirubra]|uniref:Energy-coupling factor transporter ATP-binding protein EcfA2 n=1 Tax=Saccharothrix violaceirubra TaxID=413306 RepID=A0A7W7T9J9_9PSEU|nr:hypothetical protein [Saccharothrix violaceirubra]MBB4969010.1 energy-coupling factor transporter ATP-binding protein EcfA2 [Saccharothrix violaceirubra]
MDGPSGAGKTTFAATLGGTVVPTDHFATWDNPVDWWPELVEGVLEPLTAGHAAHYRRVVWTDGTPSPGPWLTLPPCDLLVIEGVSSGRRAATPWLSELIWIEGPDEQTRLERAVARDGEYCRPDLKRWQTFERKWFTEDATRSRATKIIHAV